MTFAGKILVAKEKNTVSCVKVNVPPTSSSRFTGERCSVHAGALVMCVYEYATPASTVEARNRGEPTTPYLFVLHNEKTWEANPHSYGALEPSEVLKDKTVCFTGSSGAAREYWKMIVEVCGGTNVSGVSHNTSILVMADRNSQSTKARSAAKHGTLMVSYEEFQKELRLNEST